MMEDKAISELEEYLKSKGSISNNKVVDMLTGIISDNENFPFKLTRYTAREIAETYLETLIESRRYSERELFEKTREVLINMSENYHRELWFDIEVAKHVHKRFTKKRFTVSDDVINRVLDASRARTYESMSLYLRELAEKQICKELLHLEASNYPENPSEDAAGKIHDFNIVDKLREPDEYFRKRG